MYSAGGRCEWDMLCECQKCTNNILTLKSQETNPNCGIAMPTKPHCKVLFLVNIENNVQKFSTQTVIMQKSSLLAVHIV